MRRRDGEIEVVVYVGRWCIEVRAREENSKEEAECSSGSKRSKVTDVMY